MPTSTASMRTRLWRTNRYVATESLAKASTSELTTGKEESASLTTSEAKNAKNLK